MQTVVLLLRTTSTLDLRLRWPVLRKLHARQRAR